MATATQRWSDYRFSALGAVLSFDVVNCRNGTEALNAVPYHLNSQHPEASELRCEEPVASITGLNSYRVECTFTIPENGGEHPPDGTFSPVGSPARFRWEPGSVSERIDRDILGQAITDSALTPLDGGLSEEFPTLFFVATRYEFAPFNVARLYDFWNSLNNSSVTLDGQTFPAKTLCLRMIRPIGEYNTHSKWIETEYIIEARPDGFMKRYLDQGMRGWINDGTGVKQVPIVYANNDPISGPVLLNGRGKPLRDADYRGLSTNGTLNTLVECPFPLLGVELESTANAVFIKRHTKKFKEFSALGF